MLGLFFPVGRHFDAEVGLRIVPVPLSYGFDHFDVPAASFPGRNTRGLVSTTAARAIAPTECSADCFPHYLGTAEGSHHSTRGLLSALR